LDDLGRECDTVNLVRDFQEALKAQDATFSIRERQHGKWLEDLGDIKKAEEELARSLAEENKELEKVIETWQKRTVAGGVLSAFEEMKSKSQEWGRVMHDGITAATDAIGSGIVDGLMAMSENFRNAAQAARQMATSIVRDLARIALQLAITQALQAGFGALFGGSAISVPAGNYASVSAADRALVHTISPVAPGFQYGGYKSRSGLAVVGEAGPELVHLPGGSRVYPNSALGGGNTTVVIHNHNPQFRTQEQERSFTRQQEEQILAVVARKKNSSVMFSEAMS
jgi:lambda family phage tail tape measure protein